jgi:hypothetical protein
VLHVEHVELIGASQRAQRERAARLGRALEGSLHLRADLEGWIADPALAGSEPLRALARLHRLVDLFGAAEAEAATLTPADTQGTSAGYRLWVKLRFAAGGSVELTEQRHAGLVRTLRWHVRCEHGLLDDPAPTRSGPVFRQDTDRFLERVRTGAPSYVSEERVLEVLELVGAIERRLAAS